MEHSSGLQLVDYLVVALYFGAMIAIGAHFSGRQKTGEEYFVAGRSMPWLAVGMSLFTALTSTISYLAVTGETIRTGIGYCIGSLAALPFALGFIFVFIVPFFMRWRATSAYEYLERRFDSRTRSFGAGIFMVWVCGWMGMVVLTCSQALAAMTELPLWLILVLNGLVSTLYTVMGGIRAVIWTDVAQAGLMLAGAMCTIAYVGVTTQTNPADWWHDAQQVKHTVYPLFSLNPRVRETTFWVVLSGFVWTICAHGGTQTALQRYFTTPSAQAARRTLLITTAAEVLQTALLATCGFALLSYYLRNSERLPQTIALTSAKGADQVFPYFIAHQLPPGMGGAVVAALFAAAMSTISSGVSSMASVFTIDFYRRWKKHASTDAEEARLAHWFTAVSGVVITGLAFAVSSIPGDYNILDVLPKAYNCFLGPLGALFFVGMFLPRCTSRSAIPATCLGLALGVLLAYWEQFFQSSFSFVFWVIPCSCAATFLAAALLGLTEPRRDGNLPDGLTWHRSLLAAPAARQVPENR